MQAIDRPAAFLTAHERRLTEVQRELAIVAVVRLARDNPQDAAEYAGALNLLLTPEQRGIVWGRIGHMAALRLMREANEWYRRGGENVGIGPDAARVDEVLEWQVRSALRANDWKTVKTAIERMSPALRDDPTWIYWYGRALHEAGRPAEAQDQFARIAQQFHFYGQLAAEELGQQSCCRRAPKHRPRKKLRRSNPTPASCARSSSTSLACGSKATANGIGRCAD